MRFQTMVEGSSNEVVFRSARNGYTKTLTASVFARGTPVILPTVSASNDGSWINHAAALNAVGNELYIGNVHDFPDTSVNKTGSWQPEDQGWVQCYGVDDDAVVANGTATQAGGLILSPNTGSLLITIPQLIIPSGTASADTGVARSGVAGLAVLMQTLATSSAAGTTAAKVFLRCM